MSRAMYVFLAFGTAVVLAGFDARAGEALDVDTNRAERAWCVERAGSGDPPSCMYDNVVACAVAAITRGGFCRERASLAVIATAEKAVVARPIRHRAHALVRRSMRSTSRHRAAASWRRGTMSITERENLFREFVEWNRRHSSVARE